TSLAGVAFTKDNVRSAVTNDGLEFWTAGNGDKTANKGVFYTAPLGAAASSATNKLADSKSTRICQIAFGNLYCTGANTPLNNVFQIGTGLPTNSMANPMIFATTTLPGMPITDPAMPAVPPDPFGFAFIDTNNDQSADLLYVADDRRVIDGGGVQKWVLANGTWSLTGTTFSDAVNGSRGVAAYLSGSTVVIIASTAMDPPLPTGSPAISPVPPNAIIRFVDDQMTAPSMISPTTLITAGSDGMGAASNAFRGIALAPK
ncbi:MAG: hypothetical protein QOI66_1904, partial [Myxococcales bacterium]|nr:hypothetical protein [Myxococcales bacterium]